jgi:hypothetical protein
VCAFCSPESESIKVRVIYHRRLLVRLQFVPFRRLGSDECARHLVGIVSKSNKEAAMAGYDQNSVSLESFNDALFFSRRRLLQASVAFAAGLSALVGARLMA